jgi:hypothetical protein
VARSLRRFRILNGQVVVNVENNVSRRTRTLTEEKPF